MMEEEETPKHQVIRVPSVHVNLSLDVFHMWAEHFYRCKQDFSIKDEFSPVPYFLLCRTIELEIKSRHLHSKKSEEVRHKYGHDLEKAYQGLEDDQKFLNEQECATLSKANAIYKDKGFEYFKPKFVLKGRSTFPDLDALDAIAAKLLSNTLIGRVPQALHS